jgi:hypothetical protein
MRPPLAITAITVLTACALAGCTRSQVYTYAKPAVKEDAFNHDVAAITGTSGVTRVIPRLDGQGNASLEVYVDEDNQLPGQQKAGELGYQRVRH